MKTLLKTLLASAALLGASALAAAQIERLTLPQMISKADDGLHGEILAKEVHRVPHPHPEGGDLFFTSLQVRGKSLYDGAEKTVTVSYPGGFVDEEVGVWNSEAPTDEETRVGREVVVFFKWSEDMGGGFASNALYASHGGLFTVFETRRGAQVVQGRGDGYAVPSNRRLFGAGGLAAEAAELAAAKREGEDDRKGR